MKAVKYSNFISPVIEALKEVKNKFSFLYKKNRETDLKIKNLEKKNSDLEKRIEKLEKMVLETK